jgi:hypothetical protein
MSIIPPTNVTMDNITPEQIKQVESVTGVRLAESTHPNLVIQTFLDINSPEKVLARKKSANKLRIKTQQIGFQSASELAPSPRQLEL